MGNKNKLAYLPTKEEVIKLFENMIEPKCSMATFLALTSGLRVSEVAKLECTDVDLQRRTIRVIDSKNPNRKKQGYGKDRIAKIPMVAVSPLKQWLKIVGGGRWLFPSNKTPDVHISKKTLDNWFYDARKRAGLDRVDLKIKYKKPTRYRTETKTYLIRFHSMRHFFATYVLERTRDIYLVSKLLGHNQVSTTQRYAQMSDKQMEEGINWAFQNPVRTQMYEKDPLRAVNYNIPEIAKREKTPIEILEERFARGEISDIDFANKMRLLKLRKEYLAENPQQEKHKEV